MGSFPVRHNVKHSCLKYIEDTCGQFVVFYALIFSLLFSFLGMTINTGILVNQLDIGGLFNKGDVLKFEYYDETLYLDTDSGYIFVTWTIQ